MAVKINEALEVLFSYADDYYRARALISIPTEELLPPFKVQRHLILYSYWMIILILYGQWAFSVLSLIASRVRYVPLPCGMLIFSI